MSKSVIIQIIFLALLGNQYTKMFGQAKPSIRLDANQDSSHFIPHGLQLKHQDFLIDSMRLDAPFDIVIAHLGKPNRTEVNDIDKNYIGFYYPKITAWRNNMNARLCGLEIFDASITTQRGLKIGDSINKVERLYGKPFWSGKDFDFMGPYEYPLRGYSNALLYLEKDYHFVVLLKDKRVVRMLVYRELWLSNDDYDVQFLKLETSLDSVTKYLGIPDSIKAFYEGSRFTGYYYPKLVLWRDDHDSSLCAFDIYDSSFVTSRGLRIGDSISVIEELYGNRKWVVKEFGRTGPYDGTFDDYSEATIFGDSWYLIFFTKGQRLVKILSYVGVNE